MAQVLSGITVCTKCGASMQCAAYTPEVKCWCVSMPPLKRIQSDKSCYCGDCYNTKLRLEQEQSDRESTAEDEDQ
ncbi:MAG: hypothetical protein EB168_04015 [Euryarchaeota archaeon]|jgi:hypothetical protein|nr:hypothetical protein [Euryarchaeota archaeon]